MSVSPSAPHKQVLGHPLVKIASRLLALIGAIALGLEVWHWCRTGEFEALPS